MWNLKNKINEQTKQKQNYKYREQEVVARGESGKGRREIGKGD